jgi:hypothetical protein
MSKKDILNLLKDTLQRMKKLPKPLQEQFLKDLVSIIETKLSEYENEHVAGGKTA